MSTEYKYSREACLVAKRLFQTSRYVSKFLENYHEIKHNLPISTRRLSYTRSQLNQTRQTAIDMCMSKHPLINSTHVGETNNAGVINNWAVVATHTDQYGAVHHSTNSAVYIFAVLLREAVKKKKRPKLGHCPNRGGGLRRKTLMSQPTYGIFQKYS